MKSKKYKKKKKKEKKNSHIGHCKQTVGSANVKCKTYVTCEITLHVAHIVNTE
jgi:hypothetical protein